MAKPFATEAAWFVVDTDVQIHGACALQRGHLLEYLYRKVRARESMVVPPKRNGPSSQGALPLTGSPDVHKTVCTHTHRKIEHLM
jgi:hypothetical protein